MIDNNAIELLNMFSRAARIAQAKNKPSVEEEVNDVLLAEYFKKAFPHLRNNINILGLLKIINYNEINHQNN